MDKTKKDASMALKRCANVRTHQKMAQNSFNQSGQISVEFDVFPEDGHRFELPLPANEGLISLISVETSSPEVGFHLFLSNGEKRASILSRAGIIFEKYYYGRWVDHCRPDQDYYRDETGQATLYGSVLLQSIPFFDKNGNKEYIDEPVTITISVRFEYKIGENAFSNQNLPTKQVIEGLLKIKRHQRLKESSIKTYEKHLFFFEKFHTVLPDNQDDILVYLARFDGKSGRTKLNRQTELGQLYAFASQKYGISNPLYGLPMPQIARKPIKVLSLAQVIILIDIDIPDRDRAVLELLVGHGWRQVEIRRITAGDVRKISDGMILVHGKEREESTPILPETVELLKVLAEGLADSDLIISGRSNKELKERGMGKLVGRLFSRACIEGFTGHDLRRTFSTLVREHSGDEMLAMRLIRDQIPLLNSRYISVSDAALKEGLLKYSPLRLVKQHSPALKAEEKSAKAGDLMVEAGESRTPRPKEATQDMLQA